MKVLERVASSLQTPKAIVLDVNGTLFSPLAAIPAFKQLGLDPSLVELWYAAVLRDGSAAQASGLFRTFMDVGAHHLHVMLRRAGADDSLTGAHAMACVATSWASATMYAEIPEALRALHDGGVEVSFLTNGSVENIAQPLMASAGVLPLLREEGMMDISMPQTWKPFAAAYAFAAKRLGLQMNELMLVSSHPWDVSGAMQAGLRGAYVQRDPANTWPEHLPMADVIVPDFDRLAHVLLRQCGGS